MHRARGGLPAANQSYRAAAPQMQMGVMIKPPNRYMHKNSSRLFSTSHDCLHVQIYRFKYSRAHVQTLPRLTEADAGAVGGRVRRDALHHPMQCWHTAQVHVGWLQAFSGVCVGQQLRCVLNAPASCNGPFLSHPVILCTVCHVPCRKTSASVKGRKSCNCKNSKCLKL